MPKQTEHVTRAIRTSLVVPKSKRKKLQALARCVEKAMQAWEYQLLCMRQDDVYLTEKKNKTPSIIPGDVWQRRLSKLTGITDPGTLAKVKVFYRRLVESYDKANAGSSQQAAGKLRPMISAGSQGGQLRMQVAKDFAWLAEAPINADTLERIERQAEEDPKCLCTAGTAPVWRKTYLQEDTDGVPIEKAKWPALMKKNVRDKKEELESDEGIALELSGSDVFPLFAPTMPESSRWETTVFSEVISHLLGWETQRHKMAARRVELRKAKDKLLGKPADSEAVRMIQAFEKSRKYQLKEREIKCWPDLRKWTKKNKNATTEEREKQVKDMQRRSKNFGSFETLHWLSDIPQQHLSACKGPDPVSWLAKLNHITKKLEEAEERPLPRFTYSSAKRGVGFDSTSSTNRPGYALIQKDGGPKYAKIQLYPKGYLTFKLAGTPQLGTIQTKGKNQLSYVKSQDKQSWHLDVLGGAHLHIDNGHAELIIATARAIDADVLALRKEAVGYLRCGPEKRALRSTPSLASPGLRVVAIDFGVRTSATVSVLFKDEDGNPAHERSLKLRLPGENRLSQAERLLRKRAGRDLYRTRQAIFKMQRIARYANLEDPEARKRHYDKVTSYTPGLPEPTNAPHPEWIKTVKPVFEVAESEARELVRWLRRQKYHNPDKPYLKMGGLSVWRIDYLKKLRNVYVSWADHARPGKPTYGKTREERGSVAKSLRDLTTNLSETRAKTLADLVVQTARGYAYRDGKWVKAYPECDIIIADGLKTYKTSKTKSPKENKQTTSMGHRKIAEYIGKQATEAAIACTDVRTEYSSRFHPWTGSPGVRCHRVTAQDVKLLQEDEARWLSWQLCFAGITKKEGLELKAGDLVPVDGGKFLVAIDENDQLITVDADITAAQNNGVRFLVGHSDYQNRWDQSEARGRRPGVKKDIMGVLRATQWGRNGGDCSQMNEFEDLGPEPSTAEVKQESKKRRRSRGARKVEGNCSETEEKNRVG